MRRTVFTIPVLVGVVLMVSSCQTSSTLTIENNGGAVDAISIVASTSVYGDIASQIGGAWVNIDSIIENPDQDPHEYIADAQDQLVLSKAVIVVENGGGYDDFVDTLLSSAGNSTATVLNISDISGYSQHPANGVFNEHLWYDFPTIQKFVAELVTKLSAIDASHTGIFQANAEAFTHELASLEAAEVDLKSTFSGQGVVITESVPLYLLDAIGLVNKTPRALSDAIEQGTDVSPGTLADTQALLSSDQVKLLVYNEQTEGAPTEAIRHAAQAAGVAVVPVTETLPADKNYLTWMMNTLDAIGGALAEASRR